MKSKILYNRALWSVLFWGWAILVVILTTLPGNPEIIPDNKIFSIRLDYLEHLFFYGMLSLLFFPFYFNWKISNTKMTSFFWISAGIIFAVITEVYQLYIPNRSFNFWDMALNLTGIIAGIPVGLYLFRSLKK